MQDEVIAARRSKLPYALGGVALAGAAAAVFVVARGRDTSHGSAAGSPDGPTCASVAAHVAGMVKATDRLRPAAQGAIGSVLAKHCETDRWDSTTLGCASRARDAKEMLGCMKALGKDRYVAISKDVAAESSRREADWVVVANGAIALIEPIQVDGDVVREESKPLVAALAQKVLADHLTLELVGTAARTSSLRAMLTALGVPADRARPVIAATDGLEVRLAGEVP